jgi:hypothetical protein
LKEESTSFLKKRSKKLLVLGTVRGSARCPGPKVFAALFSKSAYLLALLAAKPPARYMVPTAGA